MSSEKIEEKDDDAVVGTSELRNPTLTMTPKQIDKPYLLPSNHIQHIPPHVVLSRIDDEVEEMKKQIRDLRYRNYTKDKGKKFEGSYTRVGFIMIITYITLSWYMYLIGVGAPFLNAIVPTVGFNLSTWSLPSVKKAWMAFYDWNFGRFRQEIRFDDKLSDVEMGYGKLDQ
jgi:hypothetical protein